MNRPCAVLITEREAVGERFRRAAGDPSRLLVASTRSEVHRLLNTREVALVLADSPRPQTSDVQTLRSIQRRYPWVRVVLLTGPEGGGKGDAWRLGCSAQLTPMPTSEAGVREVLNEHLRTAVHSASRAPQAGDVLRETLSGNPNQEIVRGLTAFIDELPALPLVVEKVLSLVQREETSPREIAGAISLDPSLAARVLRLVNSAMFAPASPVTTVQHAVALLGFSEVKNVTLGLKLMETYAHMEAPDLDRDRFWEHSLACGICARRLARDVPGIQPDEAFLGGLLHDMGKLLLDTYLGDQWREAMQRARKERISPLDAERDVIGLPHTVVGGLLAKHWGIPPVHRVAIEHHHALPEAPGPQRTHCAVVLAANLLVRWMGLGSSGHSVLRSIPQAAREALGLEEGRLEEILGQTRLEVDHWRASLVPSFREAPPAEAAEPEAAPVPQDLPSVPVWVVAPKGKQTPSLETLLRAWGHKAHASVWGDPLLELAGKIPHRAKILDLRAVHAREETLERFVQQLSSRAPGPILLLASHDTALSPSLARDGIRVLRGAPHGNALHRWLLGAVQG
jgi:HD-like signal output (HDOD) protein